MPWHRTTSGTPGDGDRRSPLSRTSPVTIRTSVLSISPITIALLSLLLFRCLTLYTSVKNQAKSAWHRFYTFSELQGQPGLPGYEPRAEPVQHPGDDHRAGAVVDDHPVREDLLEVVHGGFDLGERRAHAEVRASHHGQHRPVRFRRVLQDVDHARVRAACQHDAPVGFLDHQRLIVIERVGHQFAVLLDEERGLGPLEVSDARYLAGEPDVGEHFDRTAGHLDGRADRLAGFLAQRYAREHLLLSEYDVARGPGHGMGVYLLGASGVEHRLQPARVIEVAVREPDPLNRPQIYPEDVGVVHGEVREAHVPEERAPVHLQPDREAVLGTERGQPRGVVHQYRDLHIHLIVLSYMQLSPYIL